MRLARSARRVQKPGGKRTADEDQCKPDNGAQRDRFGEDKHAE